MKSKYSKEYSYLRTMDIKVDEMSFVPHEAVYGWKMLADLK